MALPLDSLTLTASDVGPEDTGSSLGASMPGFAPLAMPAQSFRRFSRRDRRALVAPRLARSPILTRLAVFGGAIALTAYGAYQMFKVVSIGPVTPLEGVIAALFVITFSWITLSFTSSVVGFVWLLAHRGPPNPPPCLRERTAVVMPIYNEAPSRVFGAMQAIFEDVERAGQAHAFDFILVSDTTDSNIWIAEERAFHRENPQARAIDAELATLERELARERCALAAGGSTPLAEAQQLFGLSDFERDTLLLAFAITEDPGIATLCAYLQDDAAATRLSPRLALDLLCHSAEARATARAALGPTGN